MYNWPIVRLILHALNWIVGQIGLHGVDAASLVGMAHVQPIEIVQVHRSMDLALLLVMDQVSMSLVVMLEIVPV